MGGPRIDRPRRLPDTRPARAGRAGIPGPEARGLKKPLAALLATLLLTSGGTASRGTISAAPAANTAPAAQSSAPARREAQRRSGPSLLVPASRDSYPPESEPAPFLVPGRAPHVDSSLTREGRARSY